MSSAKDILLRPIRASEAREFIAVHHYSHSYTMNSQLHIGVFWDGKLEGALQFGPSIDKRRMQGLVAGTPWDGFLELNRMAFTDALPRNSESRAIAVAMRLLRKHAPQVKWVISFADAAQCGDGTIYRASGFVLTGIKKNSEIYEMPDGEVVHELTLKLGKRRNEVLEYTGGSMSARKYVEAQGGKALEGYQLRYIYFLYPGWRENLSVSEIPFSRIWEIGAGMYKGEKCAEQRA